MTSYSDWEKECERLKKMLSAARRRKTICKGPLAEKLERILEVRAVEEKLRQHKLNYFGYGRPEL